MLNGFAIPGLQNHDLTKYEPLWEACEIKNIFMWLFRVDKNACTYCVEVSSSCLLDVKFSLLNGHVV